MPEQDLIIGIGSDNAELKKGTDESKALLKAWASEVTKEIESIPNAKDKIFGEGDSEDAISLDIDIDSSKLDEAKDKFKALAESSKGVPSKWAGLAKTLAKSATLITVVASAAQAVYNWGLKSAESWSGFNDANEKAIQLAQELGETRSKKASEGIRDAQRINVFAERRLELENRLKDAQNTRQNAKKQFEAAQEAADVGAVGQFFDGKVNSELGPELERTQAAFKGSEAAVKKYQEALSSLSSQEASFKQKILEGFELEFTKLQKTKREYLELKFARQGADSQTAKKFADNQIKIDELADAKKLEEAFKRQLQALKLKNIELTKGPEAAQQERDKLAGFEEKERKQLANMRAENQAIVDEMKKKAEEKKKATEEEKERAKEAERSLQKLASMEKNLAKQKEQADKDQERRRKSLLNLIEKREDKIREKNKVLGGFSSLEGLGTRIANAASKRSNDDSAREIEKINKEIRDLMKDRLTAEYKANEKRTELINALTELKLGMK